jgi:hypothetical protein
VVYSVCLVFKLFADFTHPINNYFPTTDIRSSRVVYLANMLPWYHLFKNFVERCITLEIKWPLLLIRIVHWGSDSMSCDLAVSGTFAYYKKPAILTITTENTACNLKRWVFLGLISIGEHCSILIHTTLALKSHRRLSLINEKLPSDQSTNQMALLLSIVSLTAMLRLLSINVIRLVATIDHLMLQTVSSALAQLV